MPEFLPEDFAGEALRQSGRRQIRSPAQSELVRGFPCFTPSERDPSSTLTAPERQALEQSHSIRANTNINACPTRNRRSSAAAQAPMGIASS